jgi:predicted nucleotidyltransferase
MQKNQKTNSDTVGSLLNETEILLKEIITEGKKRKVKSLRTQTALPMNMPLSNLFMLDGVMDAGEGVSEKMMKYGKFINEYLSEFLDENHELYDIVEDYDVFKETEVLVDKWINLEFLQNVMKYNQSKGGDFSEQEYKRLAKESEQLANEIYKSYGTFDWIRDAEKKMIKMEKDFAKENPDYLKWASQNTNQTSLNVFEDKENKPLNKPMKGDVKKYKVYVRDKKTGNIKKVNFGDPNMEIKRDDPERRKSFRARHNCDTATDKTTPRYWSCKFWSKKSVSDLLSEIVDPKTVEVEYLKVKDQLNPKIWKSEDKLNPQVRAALLKNAMEFIKYLNLEKLPIKDIVFTGSLANYTWTDFSDLDVHVITDFNELDVDDDTLRELFKTKKSLWETKVKAKVKGYDVELYVEDTNEEVNSTGVYSLIKDQWIEKPIKQVVGIDTSDIQLKSASLMNLIDHLEGLEDSETKVQLFDALKEKLANYRKAGLQSEGEFSTENLVFKILRNNGYLKKIKDAKTNSLNKELSLEYENKN